MKCCVAAKRRYVPLGDIARSALATKMLHFLNNVSRPGDPRTPGAVIVGSQELETLRICSLSKCTYVGEFHERIMHRGVTVTPKSRALHDIESGKDEGKMVFFIPTIEGFAVIGIGNDGPNQDEDSS
jgi:hypothetical protein